MRKIIKSITLEDFRSFETESIELEDVTCLVGANESGKTNLLDSINLALSINTMAGGKKRLTSIADTRKNSERYKNRQSPKITYTLAPEIITNPLLREALAITLKGDLLLIREDNAFRVEIPPIKTDFVVVKNISEKALKLGAVVEEEPSSEETPSSKTKLSAAEITKLPAGESLTLMNYSAFLPSIEKAVSENLALAIESKNLNRLILDEIQKNLKIFFWSYDKEKYSLPDMVAIDAILTDVNSLPLIKALFKLGGYSSVEDIQSILEDRSPTDYVNIFNQMSETITYKIRQKWTSNKNLKLEVIHQTDRLLLNIKDPGYSIEPQFRSEGIRWFLAFIIGMVAEAETLSDYVILIDEPALFLHPGGQKDVLKEINQLATDNQIVYSTHSHFMIDKRFSKRLRYVIKEITNDYSLSKVRTPSKKEIFKDPLLRASLVYTVSDISYLNELNILVEGSLDERVISLVNHWLITNDKVESALDTNLVAIINCDGASEIGKHAGLYKGNGLICLSLYDSDKSGVTAKDKNIAQQDNEKIQIADILNKPDTTMEDMIPLEVFSKAINEWELKIDDGKLTIPRMVEIDKVMNSQTSTLNGVEVSIERKRLKHRLEDLIILHLEEYLQNPKQDQIEPLSKLVNNLNEKLKNLTR